MIAQEENLVKKIELDLVMANNMVYINFYSVCVAIGALQISLAKGGLSNLIGIFEAKFGWDDSQRILYSTVINTATIIGIVIGNNLGGMLARNGRRKAIFQANCVFIIACAI